MTKKIFFSLFIVAFFTQSAFSDNVKIVDGDTIRINDEKIRFLGIDAPELNQNCIKNDEKISCGILAKEALIKKIGNK